MKKKLNPQSGMTLIEIILVLVLLGSVMAVVGKKVFNTFLKGQTKTAELQIKTIEGLLDQYRLDCHQYPTTEQGLSALIEKPSTGPDCVNYSSGGYSEGKKNFETDPWGNKFQYRCDDGINYEIISLGADRQVGGEGANADLNSKE